jgi:hypothetical protein
MKKYNDISNYEKMNKGSSLDEEMDNLLKALDDEGKKNEAEAAEEGKAPEAEAAPAPAVAPAAAAVGTVVSGQDVKAADGPTHNGPADVSQPGEVIPTAVPTTPVVDKAQEVTPAVAPDEAQAEVKTVAQSVDVAVDGSKAHDGEADSVSTFKEQLDDIIAALKRGSLNEEDVAEAGKEAEVVPADAAAPEAQAQDVKAPEAGHDGEASAPSAAAAAEVTPTAADAQVINQIAAGQDVKAADSATHNGPANAGEAAVAAAPAVQPAPEEAKADGSVKAVETEAVKGVKEDSLEVAPEAKEAIDAGHLDGVAKAADVASPVEGNNKFYPECAKTDADKASFDADYDKYLKGVAAGEKAKTREEFGADWSCKPAAITEAAKAKAAVAKAAAPKADASAFYPESAKTDEAKAAFDADYDKYVKGIAKGDKAMSRQEFASGWVCPVCGGEAPKADAVAAAPEEAPKAEGSDEVVTESAGAKAVYYPAGVETPDQKKAFNIAYFLAKRGHGDMTRQSFAKTYVVNAAAKGAGKGLKEDEAVVTPTADAAQVTDTVASGQDLKATSAQHDGQADANAPEQAAVVDGAEAAAGEAGALKAQISQPQTDVVAQDSLEHDGAANADGEGQAEEGCEDGSCECPEDDDECEYESVKEALMKGPAYFKGDDRRTLKLIEQMSLIRAKDSGDILFEAMIEHATAAEKIRKRLIEKYGVLATRQVVSLLEDLGEAEGDDAEGGETADAAEVAAASAAPAEAGDTAGEAAKIEADATKVYDSDAQIKSGDAVDTGTVEHAEKVAQVAAADAQGAPVAQPVQATPAPADVVKEVAPKIADAVEKDAHEPADDVKKDDVAGGLEVEAKADAAQ